MISTFGSQTYSPVSPFTTVEISFPSLVNKVIPFESIVNFLFSGSSSNFVIDPNMNGAAVISETFFGKKNDFTGVLMNGCA